MPFGVLLACLAWVFIWHRSEDSEHRGHQRAGQADADEPERAVPKIGQAAGPGLGEDAKDQRRHERPGRQRTSRG